MPSYLDLGLLAVIFISALLAMLRGFTREILAIASWIAAAAAAIYFYPYLVPYLKPYSFFAKDWIAALAAGTIIFHLNKFIKDKGAEEPPAEGAAAGAKPDNSKADAEQDSPAPLPPVRDRGAANGGKEP